LVEDAHVHVQRLVSVVKMATVLEVRNTKEQCSAFLWANGLDAKDIHTEMFPVYGGKCMSHKAVHNLVEIFSQVCSKVAVDAQPCAQVTKINSQNTSVLRVSTHW
jgi:hypothetical protein